MTLGKRWLQACGAVLLGALISSTAVAQITTRFVNPGAATTSTKILPGGAATFEVRIDAGEANIGGSFNIVQSAPALNGFFSITGRSFTGSVWNDTASGTPDATVFAAASALLDPQNNDNLGRNNTDLVFGTPAANNQFALSLTLTSSGTTPLGTYSITPSAGNSFVTGASPLFTDFPMAGQFDIIVGQTLTVTKSGTGTGTVTSDVGIINCGATCADIYPGSTVILTAAPTGGSTFAGWSGGGCSGTGTCSVTVTAATTVNAQFDPPPVGLTVVLAGSGTGSVSSSPAGITCGADCFEAYPGGTVVTLTAVANAGSTFAGWSGGGCSGTGTCVVTVNASTTVTATFNIQTFVLTVTKSGNGTGVVTSAPAGINCGADCTEPYNFNTVVTLTAVADATSNFIGWSGGGCSGTGTCVVTMTAATSVNAQFTDTTPPDTTITGNPTDPSNQPNPVFTFTSTEPGGTFQCSLNGSPNFACSSPYTATVTNGPNTFSVFAVDLGGNPDPTPAVYAWTVAGAVLAAPILVPTLSEWSLILMSLLLAGFGMVAFRRKQ